MRRYAGAAVEQFEQGGDAPTASTSCPAHLREIRHGGGAGLDGHSHGVVVHGAAVADQHPTGSATPSSMSTG